MAREQIPFLNSGFLDAVFYMQIMAEVMGAEAALMRIQFVSGTHAIATALFSVLRPGDELLAVAGKPYDTLEEVIGLRGTPGHGSLKEWGVSYREMPLAADGSVDLNSLPEVLTPSKDPLSSSIRLPIA